MNSSNDNPFEDGDPGPSTSRKSKDKEMVREDVLDIDHNLAIQLQYSDMSENRNAPLWIKDQNKGDHPVTAPSVLVSGTLPETHSNIAAKNILYIFKYMALNNNKTTNFCRANNKRKEGDKKE
ncbi:hypothetical protein VKS41_006383 [Umbelopsis sp. WA50703]